MISDKASQIGASPTLKISAKAKSMKDEGIDIVDLSIGEPDFFTTKESRLSNRPSSTG